MLGRAGDNLESLLFHNLLLNILLYTILEPRLAVLDLNPLTNQLKTKSSGFIQNAKARWHEVI